MTEAIKSWFSKRADNEMKDLSSKARSHPRVAIAGAMVLTLIVLYLIAHQLWSTGFFTSTFGPFEMLLLYGSLIEWIVVAFLEVFGRKNVSRDIDAFGGIIFVTIGGIWLFMVFPFDFAYFANVLPESIRFLVQWISNDIAWVIMVILMILHLLAAIYCPFGYKFVDKKRFKRKKISD